MSAHVHDTRQIFLLLGEQDSLHAWVSLDGQKSHVTSPALIWVPAGIMHALQVIKGPGIALSILERGTYA
ncbi:MAG: hypothetical protein M5U01_30015 [Ardenticatenaceae bacterium]|nr:hypothetical protein [Ardenticatenaceae bacterium]